MAFSMGKHTLSVSAELFAENRRRLVSELRNRVAPGHRAVLLQGGAELSRYNTDMGLVFRQESYFFWTFGVQENDSFGAIFLDSGKSILFPPRLHPDYAIWQGRINPESYFKDRYMVDEVYFNDEGQIANVLKKMGIEDVLLLRAENSDSGEVLQPAEFSGQQEFRCDTKLLYPIIADLRVFKTDRELDVIRYVCKVSSDAHKSVMRATKPNLYEYQLESIFCDYCYRNGGCRHVAYTCIASSGHNCAVLHYGHANAPNDRQFSEGDLCLLDMGAEYNCYASDITISFPCSGKFTEKQKVIYYAVLDANRQVFSASKPGVRWSAMHVLAERVILSHLRDAGILKGDVDAMQTAGIGAIFMPHGLGHFMGLDVHDCGGYLGDAEPRSKLMGLKSLRTTRTLQERMVITIEPGCYFIDSLLSPALQNEKQKMFFDVAKLNEYRDVGGVRIEDDIVIWARGNECMSNVPRTVHEIEQFMSTKTMLNESAGDAAA